MRIAVISDTHGRHSSVIVPRADVIVHCGDLTAHSTGRELTRFLAWYSALRARVKIVIGGNHDRIFEDHPKLAASLIPEGIVYLQDSGCEIGGLRFWGSPVQPEFMNWAFNRARGSEITTHWAMIPDGTDVIVTHGPAFGILDRVPSGLNVGCADLRRRIEAIQPRAHLCGHIHSGYGLSQLGKTIMVNASICDEYYRPVNPPIVLDL